MKNTLKSRITLAAFAAALTMSAHVGAASITLNSSLGLWTDANPDGRADGIGTSEIRWGAAANDPKSGYIYEGAAPPSVSGIGFGEHFVLGTFTHENYPIYAGTQIYSAELTVDYSFDVVADDNTVLGTRSGTSVFDFGHRETRNASNPCADGDPNGQGVNANGCADRVRFDLDAAETISFMVLGKSYVLDLVGFLVDGEIVEEFWTAEGLANSAELVAKVTVVPLPAAAPLFASVLGLFGLLRLRSRKDSARSTA